MEKNFSDKESLLVIRQMIESSKRNLSDQSIYYLLWGWSVLGAAMSQYVLISLSITDYHWVPWPVLMALTAIISISIGFRKSRKRKAITFIDHTMHYLWSGFLLYILVVLLMSTRIGWAASYVLVIGLYGLGTFVSGGVLRYRPLIFGGLASIGLAFLGIFGSESISSFPNLLLLLSLSIVLSYLIPGYMLKFKRQNHATQT